MSLLPEGQPYLTYITTLLNEFNLAQPAFFLPSHPLFPFNLLIIHNCYLTLVCHASSLVMLFSPLHLSSLCPASHTRSYLDPSSPYCFAFPVSDVAVQLPDKKSIIMYVTSLFAVLPKDVSMEAIREVETLPRKYKVEAEGSGPGLSAQVNYTVQLLLQVK